MENKAQVIILPTENNDKGIYLNPVKSIDIIHFWDKKNKQFLYSSTFVHYFR